MAEIRVLDEHTANRIAAGEVVERPASIVKELMENAVDAGADRIAVEVEGGGISSIRVSDNGSGITGDEIPLAFLRHATSKISSPDDLYAIETMGFRGEALPSIAAVSRVTLESATDEGNGVRYIIHGGQVIERLDAAVPQGTRITVQDVFFNTPARKKFLKSEQAEGRAIIDMVSKLAIGRPDISISLKNEGKMVFKTRGNGDLQETLAYIFPADITRRLLSVDHQSDFFRIQGLVGPAFTYRANRDMQLFYINDRYVRSQALSRALEEAYRQRIPLRKYPVGILKLSVHAASVDVNIHPSKLEVKFSMEDLICRELTRFVREVLNQQQPMNPKRENQVRETGEPFQHRSAPRRDWENIFHGSGQSPQDKNASAGTQESFAFPTPRKHREGSMRSDQVGQDQDLKQQTPGSHSPRESTTETIPITQGSDRSSDSTDQEKKAAAVRHRIFLEMEPMGMVGSAYLLARKDTRLFLIDQHAAHERIRYDRLKAYFADHQLTTQLLLEPVVLDLGFLEKQRVVDHILSFRTYGFLLELFGEEQYLLRGVPQGLEKSDYPALFQEVLEMLESGAEDIREKMLQMASCRGAVKAGQSLTNQEIRQLLDDLARAEFPYTCPHGRPTMLELDNKTLEKMFLRT